MFCAGIRCYLFALLNYLIDLISQKHLAVLERLGYTFEILITTHKPRARHKETLFQASLPPFTKPPFTVLKI